VVDRQARTNLYHRYNKASDLPLLVLALLMIPLILAPELFKLSPEQANLVETLDWFIYACFAADFIVKLYLAPSITDHLKRNWLDVIVLALPLLRPLRILQGARVLRLLMAARVLAFLVEALRKLRGILAGRGLHVVMLVTLGVVVSTAWLVSVMERDSGGSIKEFGDALWWAVATVTTVGYGDAIPVTPEGRGLAVFLMIVGIVFYSILTANIAAYFVEAKGAKSEADLDAKVDLLLQQQALLLQRIQSLEQEGQTGTLDSQQDDK
jgi:voltage-gated potassium channel